MLMVTFGAGASYDSGPTHPVGQNHELDETIRPPLAKDLFGDREVFHNALDTYPQCGTIVPRLRDFDVTSGKASIETRLQELQDEAQYYPRGQVELPLCVAICGMLVNWNGRRKHGA